MTPLPQSAVDAEMDLARLVLTPFGSKYVPPDELVEVVATHVAQRVRAAKREGWVECEKEISMLNDEVRFAKNPYSPETP